MILGIGVLCLPYGRLKRVAKPDFLYARMGMGACETCARLVVCAVDRGRKFFKKASKKRKK